MEPSPEPLDAPRQTNSLDRVEDGNASREDLAARIGRARYDAANLRTALQSLLASARHALRAMRLEVVPEATPDSLPPPTPAEVAAFLVSRSSHDPTLPRRLRTAIERGDVLTLADVLRMTDAELARIPNIGSLALRALRDWVESKSEGFGLRLSRADVRLALGAGQGSARATACSDQPERLGQALADLPAVALGLPLNALRDVPGRVRSVLEAGDCALISDIVQWSYADLIEERGIGEASIEQLIASLADLTRRTARICVDATPNTEELRTALTAGNSLDETLQAFLARLPERAQEILRARVFTTAPCTLEDLGDRYGITRERVRQIEAKALKQLDTEGYLRESVDAKLRRARGLHDSLLTLSALSETDPFFAGVGAEPGRLLGFLAAAKTECRVVDWPGHGWCVTPKDLQHPDKVREKLRRAFSDSGVDRAEAAVVRQFVTDINAVELMNAVSELCGLERGDDGDWHRPRTRRERILAIMQGEPRPWHIDEVHLALQNEQVRVDPLRVRADLDAMRTEDRTVVRTGRSSYVVVSTLAAWEPHLDLVRAKVVPTLQANPEALISTDDLLAKAIEDIADWPRDMPAHALEFLLFRCEEVRFAGLWLWQAADHDSPARRTIVELAVEILEEHGEPMPRTDLLSTLRRSRSAGVNPILSFPVYENAGLVYLIERDVGIRADAYRAWSESVSKRLMVGRDSIDGSTLAKMLLEHGGREHGAEHTDLLTMLGRESRFAYDRQRRVLRLAKHIRRG